MGIQQNLAKADRRTLNSYDRMYNAVSNKPLFNQEDWIKSANDGTIDMYVQALLNSDLINTDEYHKKYNTLYANSKTRLAALYNETFSNRDNVDTKRKSVVENDEGLTEGREYLASDYEYNLKLIRNQNDYNQQLRQKEIAQDMKDSMNAGDHILSTLIGIPTGLLSGAMRGVDNITALIGSAGEAIVSRKGDVVDNFTENLASNDYRFFSDIRQDIIDFETKYTSLRNADGQYTTYGKYLGGVATSLGEMLPSMLIGKGVGKVFGSKAGSIASQGSFYAGMGAGNVQDMYEQFEGADVDSAAILSNAAIKSTLQFGVERGLGKILGATSLDNMVFGKPMTGMSGSTLTNAGLKTVFKDALQEGLEEVLQDTSDFLVDRAYGVFINEFKNVSDISWQSLIDAFVIGGICSFAGSARNLIFTKNVQVGDTKLNKIASWQYGVNVQSLFESLNSINTAVTYNENPDVQLSNAEMRKIKTATMESYAAYRMVTSVYNEIGEDRFKAANNVLSRITDKIKTGFFNIDDVSEYVNNMNNVLRQFSEKDRTDIAKQMMDGGVTESVIVEEDKLESVKEATGAEEVVVVDGNVKIEHNDKIILSEKFLNDDTNDILQDLSVKKLVKNLVNFITDIKMMDDLVDLYKKWSGEDSVEHNLVVTALLFDKNFFTVALLNGNKDIYKLLSQLSKIEKDIVRGKLRNEIYRNTINKIRKKWFESLTEYCIIHNDADVNDWINQVTDSKDRKTIYDRIKRERWSGDVYNRVVVTGVSALSDAELEGLHNRFNNVFSKSQATLHWNNINSDRPSVRQASMNALSKKYNNIFNSKYDGKTYMTDTSIGNRVFNKFLQSINATVENFLDENRLTDADKLVNTDVSSLRHEQFKLFTHGAYDFEIKNKSLRILYKNEIVGYTNFDKIIDEVESGRISNTFVDDTSSRNTVLSKMIKDGLGLSKNYYTVDDVIVEPDLLNDDVKKEIIDFAKSKYNVGITHPDPQFTFLYLRDYFINNFKNTTIVVKQDGRYAFASVSKVADVFLDPNVKITKNSKLEDIFKKDKIPQGLKLKIVDGSSTVSFVPYGETKIGEDNITIIDNTIYVGEKLFTQSDDYIRFAFAHEFQHAVQFANRLNFGLNFNLFKFMEPKQVKTIIADIRKHKPSLFSNVEVGSTQEYNIAQNYLYHSTGESQAYGLEGTGVIDFEPILSNNVNNVLTLTFPWGKSYVVKNIIRNESVSQSIVTKLSENLYQFTELKDLDDGRLNFDNRVNDWRIVEGRLYYFREPVYRFLDPRMKVNKEYRDRFEELRKYRETSDIRPLIREWIRLPMNTDAAKSESVKNDIKKKLTQEDKHYSIEIMRHLIAPDIPLDEFVDMDVNYLRMQRRGHLGDSPFVSIYAGATENSIYTTLNGFYRESSHPNDALDTYMIVGTFKPKDILYYIEGYQSEVLIEPSKLKNAKIFKMNNEAKIVSDAHNYSTLCVDSNGHVIFNVFADVNDSGDTIYFINGLTGELFSEYNMRSDTWNNKITHYKHFGKLLDLDELDFVSSNETPSDFLQNDNYLGRNIYDVKASNGRSEILRGIPVSGHHNVVFSLASESFQEVDTDFSRLAVTDPNGRVITAEETQTSLTDLFNEYGMFLKPNKDTKESKHRKPNKNELSEHDSKAKNFVSSERKPNAKYSERYYVLNDDGTQKLHKDGTPVYHYIYKNDTRYVGKRKYKGTNLEFFNKKYTPLQMSKNMQDFILKARDLDPILQERINGSKAGTLTERDVMDYLRSASKIDDKTFKAINDAFFKNKYIKTFEELESRIDTTLAQSWAFYRLVKTDEKVKVYDKLLESTESDVHLLVEAIENNKDADIAKHYGRLYSNFDQLYERALDIKDEYARMSYMRLFDGTIASEWKIAANVRYVAIHNYNTTHKVSLPEEATTDAYQDIVDGMDLSRGAMIEAVKNRELALKAKELADKGESYRNHVSRLLEEASELEEKLELMTTAQIKKLYEAEGGISKIVAEGLIAQTTGELVDIPDDVPKITSAAIVNNIRGFLNTIRRNLTPKEIDKLVEKHSDLFEKNLRLKKEVYQNVINNKTVPGVHYRNKSVEELCDLLDRVVIIKNEILDEKRFNRESKRIKDNRERELMRRIKELERENKELSSKKNQITNNVTQFVVENETINLRTNVPVPDTLKKFLQRQYEDKANTTVKNLSEADEKHVKMMSKDFYESNADALNNLTQGDVNEIVDFYTKPNVPLSEITAPYIATEIWVLTYLIESGRKGSALFVIDEQTLKTLESTLKNLQSAFGTGQVTWREALKRLNPSLVVAQSLSTSLGIDIAESDMKSLLKAVQSRNMENVEKEKNRIYKKYLKTVMKKNANRRKLDKALDKILQYERLAMLSGPGTWVRNATSNAIIEGTNRLSDNMSGKVEKLLFKLFPKSQKVKNQYQIAGTKVTEEVKNYIQNNLIDNGLLDSVMDALIKYDVRRDRKGDKSETVLTELIANSIKSMYRSEHLSDNKYVSRVEDFIRKMISDNKAVKKAAISYLGKMITEDIANGKIVSKTEVLSQNRISKQFLNYVAEAYKMAGNDFMHKSNFLMHLESRLAHKSAGAYFVYKQLFPFAGASWNWFVEGLNYTPVGLVKSIINFAKLENTVEKMDEARRQYKNNDVGVSSDFAKYLTIRNINKGVIGSIGFVIGALLAGFGWARLDEEDDRYKLVINDEIYVDVSDLFGTQGIFFGISIVNSIQKNSSVIDVLSAGLDQLFIDSTFSDVFNNFRYSESFADWLLYQPYSMLNMMIPNFIKTITSVSTPYKVKYSDGIKGKAEKLMVNAIPGISYALPHYYDPYTGEKQITYKLWGLSNLVNKLTPFGLHIYNVSDIEKLCIEYGVNKSQLSGRYTINGETIKLKASDVEKLNIYYGKLNAKSLDEFESKNVTFRIKQSNGTYKNVKWRQLTDKEKAAIVNRTMTNNSGYAKIYILTDSGNYKYYASENEYKELKKLGLTKNVYKASKNRNGFVKIN